MLSKHLFRKHKGISAVPVVVILMLVGVVVGILTYTVAMDVSWEAEMGANEAYHIITEDEIKGLAHGVEGAYGGGTITPGSPGGSGGSGWYGGADGTFKQDSITIFFKTDAVNNQSKGYHTTITGIAKIPEDVYGGYAEPTRDGYVFAGWYTDAACTAGNEFDMITYLPNRTVYAKWLPNT